MKKGKMFLIVIGTLSMMIVMAVIAKVIVDKNSFATNSDSILQLGMECLKEGDYKQAIVEFEKSSDEDSENKKTMALLELARVYELIDESYKNKEYEQTTELLEKVKEMPYVDIIENNIDDMSKKILMIKGLEEKENKIKKLVDENSFNEAIELANKCLDEEMEDEYKNRISNLIITAKEANEVYAKEQFKIESEREALKKSEEEKKKKESSLKSTVDSNSEAERLVSKLSEVKECVDLGIKLYYFSDVDNVDGMSGYSVDVRMQSSDPMLTTALGFYFVNKSNSKVYRMDVLSGNYVLAA